MTTQTTYAHGPINLNQQVRVKILPPGLDLYDAYYRHVGMEPPPLKMDDEGYCLMQLWWVANVFGPGMIIGGNPPIETTIHVLPLP